MMKNNDLKNYLKECMDTVPYGDYKNTKDKIIEACYITGDVWGNWISGRTPIPELAKPIIEEIVGCEVFLRDSNKEGE